MVFCIKTLILKRFQKIHFKTKRNKGSAWKQTRTTYRIQPMLLLFIVLSNFSYSVSCILWILSVDHGFTQFCPLLSICAFCFGKFIFFVLFPYSFIVSVVQLFTTRWTNGILCFVELPFLAGFTLINVAFMSRLIAIT